MEEFCSAALFTIKPDGSDGQEIRRLDTSDGTEVYFSPQAWSPDGTAIAFDEGHNNDVGFYTIKPDGTGLTFVMAGPVAADWSPDGTKMTFARGGQIWTMNADGSAQTPLTSADPSYQDQGPIWSPDGNKIAFSRLFTGTGKADIVTMNADGSSPTNITNTPAINENWLSWQPIPLSYARPKGATPTRVALVPAFAQCTSPNRTHGAPLAFPSCASPTQTSGYLTIGSPDSNGQGANSSGYVRFAVAPGDPFTPGDQADIGLKVSVTDVRRKSDLSDYSGELELVTRLRITDRDNTPNPGGPGPGTVEDTPLTAAVSCTPTASTTIGSSCTLQTTIDALYPGAVKETRRSIWQLGQVQVLDGGSDDLASTTADNTLFMVQGVFAP
jgi:hypothetical protein